MQQDLEDKKNEIIIEGLEKKIKDHEAFLKKKDFLLQTMEGSLAEVQAEVARLSDELLWKSENFEQEKKSFDARLELLWCGRNLYLLSRRQKPPSHLFVHNEAYLCFFMLIEALSSKSKYLFVLYVMMMMILRMSTWMCLNAMNDVM
jgi:hypothetical protein